MTGQSNRCRAVCRSRRSTRDAARTSGYRADDVRGRGGRSRHPREYVDHALDEHGLARDRPRAAGVIDESPTERTPSSVARRGIEYELVVDGEMPDDDFDLLVDVIRARPANAAPIDAVGRSFSWQSEPGNEGNLQVSVLPRGGKTTIRVSGA